MNFVSREYQCFPRLRLGKHLKSFQTESAGFNFLRRIVDGTPIKNWFDLKYKTSIQIYLTLNDWSRGERWILFPRISGGNKIHCSPRDQSLSDLLCWKTKQKQNLKTALRIQPSRATAVNISRGIVNCFPFDVIVFVMLPAHGSWRETVSLLDVRDHELAKDWKTKQKQNLKTALRFQPSRATAVNIFRVTVNCFPFDVIVFAMLPAHGSWRETVSLLDVTWPWTSQRMGAL